MKSSVDDWNEWMIRKLKSNGTIRSRRLIHALEDIPRTWFLPSRFYITESEDHEAQWIDFDPNNPEHLEIVHTRALVMKKNGDVPISVFPNPGAVPTMLNSLDVEPGHTVLEVGTASGYQTALLSKLVGDEGNVVSLEVDDEILSEGRRNLENHGFNSNIRLELADGWKGFEPEAPYDRIVINVSCRDVSRSWLNQLDSNGRLLVPMRRGAIGSVLRIDRSESDYSGCFCADLQFQSLRSDDHPSLDTNRNQYLNDELDRLSVDPGKATKTDPVPRKYPIFLGLGIELTLLSSHAFHAMKPSDTGVKRVLGLIDPERNGVAYFHNDALWHGGDPSVLDTAQEALRNHKRRKYPTVYEYRFDYETRSDPVADRETDNRIIELKSGRLKDITKFNV